MTHTPILIETAEAVKRSIETILNGVTVVVMKLFSRTLKALLGLTLFSGCSLNFLGSMGDPTAGSNAQNARRYEKSLTLLHVATMGGALADVEKLANPKTINQKTSKDETALFLAVDRGLDAVVQTLIKKGADVNVADVVGVTPLMKAVEHGNLAIAKMLLKSNANVNATEKTGYNAAFFAADKSNLQMLKLLTEYKIDLKHVADTGLGDKFGLLAYSSGKYPGHQSTSQELAFVKYLVETARLDSNGIAGETTPLMRASTDLDLPLVSYLLSRGANAKTVVENVSFQITTDALFSAVIADSSISPELKKAQMEIVAKLLKAGANPKAKLRYHTLNGGIGPTTSVEAAKERGDPALIKALGA
jgi:ankyrin repeat protein